MTLLALLGLLLGTYAVLAAIDRVRPGAFPPPRRGQIALGALFVFTGLGHFVQTDGMAQMLPASVPARTTIILASGVLEWLLALGLFLPRCARPAGIAAIVFLIAVFPGNVYAALNHVNFGGHGAGPVYLLVRGPFQLLLIAWAWHFAVK